MFGAILKTTNSSFQKGMPFCHSIYVKKVMKLLALYLNSPRILFETFYRSSGSQIRSIAMVTMCLIDHVLVIVLCNTPCPELLKVKSLKLHRNFFQTNCQSLKVCQVRGVLKATDDRY